MRRQTERNGRTEIVLAGLLAVVVAAGAVWYFFSRSAPDNNNFPGGDLDPPAQKKGEADTASLGLVPADAPAFGTIAVAKWWNSEQGKQFQQQIAELEPSPQIEKHLGLPPEK